MNKNLHFLLHLMDLGGRFAKNLILTYPNSFVGTLSQVFPCWIDRKKDGPWPPKRALTPPSPT